MSQTQRQDILKSRRANAKPENQQQQHAKPENQQQQHARVQIDPYENLKIKFNRDGTLTRLEDLPTVEASEDNPYDEGMGVLSKDVIINPETKSWVRIYRCHSNDLKPGVRQPIVLYFHGGSFIKNTAGSVFCHNVCERITRFVPCIVVSVSYRLAPEHRLPAAYEDADDTLLWLKKHAMGSDCQEPWLTEIADFSRIVFFGWNCGGNIAFHARLRALDLDLGPLKIHGIMLNQPLFGGIERTGSDLKYADDQMLPLSVSDLTWELALPVGANRDHGYCNPWNIPNIRQKISKMGRVLMRGYGGDITIDRQRKLMELLLKNGAEVEAFFDEVGFHGIDIIDSRRAMLSFNYLRELINSTANTKSKPKPQTHSYRHSKSSSRFPSQTSSLKLA